MTPRDYETFFRFSPPVQPDAGRGTGKRALKEAASAHANRIEPAMIESAASTLDLLRIRPKRFRWYGTR